MHLHFTDSPLLKQRRGYIQKQIDIFYTYLRGIGLEPPLDVTPMIGVMDAPAVSISGGWQVIDGRMTPTSQTFIRIGKGLLDRPDAIRITYADR